MSDLTHGMDVAAVEELGQFLKTKAGELDQMIATIDGRTRSTSWHGPDADRFRNDWPQHRTRLRSSAERIRGLGQSAQNNAAEQRRTSDEAQSGPSKSQGNNGASSNVGTGVDVDTVVDGLEKADKAQNLLRLLRLLDEGKNWDEVTRMLRTGGKALPDEYFAGLGAIVGTAKVLQAARDYGWTSNKTIEEIASAVGSEVVGKYAPIVGPLVWDSTWNTFLEINEGAKDFGDALGNAYVDNKNATFNTQYGSEAGYNAGSWLLHTYGVADFDDLGTAQALEASRRYSEHLREAGGFYQTVLGSWWQEGQWALEDVF